MPTPSDGLHDLQTPLGTESLLRRSANTTCPPDDSRVIAQGAQAPDDSQDRLFDPEEMVPQQTPTPPADAEPMRMCEQDGSHNGDDRTRKERLLAVDLPSPPASASDAKDVDAHVDMSDVQAQSQPSSVSAGISPIHFDLPHARVRFEIETMNVLPLPILVLTRRKPAPSELYLLPPSGKQVSRHPAI